jgi:hypothetical protein
LFLVYAADKQSWLFSRCENFVPRALRPATEPFARQMRVHIQGQPLPLPHKDYFAAWLFAAALAAFLTWDAADGALSTTKSKSPITGLNPVFSDSNLAR